MACATLEDDGRYRAQAPKKAGDTSTLVDRLQRGVGPGGIVLLGFDFPIGLPISYAKKAGVTNFLALLPQIGHGEWSDFFTVAERPEQISLRRPFYPQHPGMAKQHRLEERLGHRFTDLLRRCERAQAYRKAASPLFWTLDAKQAGKAAIHGWKNILGPALGSRPSNLAIWPFSGQFLELLQPGYLVIVETYPAEFYHHLGLGSSGERWNKRKQEDRKVKGQILLKWSSEAGVSLNGELREQISDGFGSERYGEDTFDATVGLSGMLNVVFGHRAPGNPNDESICKIEGWIFGMDC